jgi:hypothetical protein
MAIRVERQVGPTGVHYEARILRDPKNPETSEWTFMYLEPERGIDGDPPSVTGDSYAECLSLVARSLEEDAQPEKVIPKIVIARVETTYITPTEADLGQEMMQVHRIPKGRRFRLEEEPGPKPTCASRYTPPARLSTPSRKALENSFTWTASNALHFCPSNPLDRAVTCRTIAACQTKRPNSPKPIPKNRSTCGRGPSITSTLQPAANNVH